MLLLQWLLLFLDCRTQASHFSGTTMTYYPKETPTNGFVSVILRYKSNYVSCQVADAWTCNGNCGTEIQITSSAKVDENRGEWCQSESVTTRQLLNNFNFQLEFTNGAWINNIKNNIGDWKAVTGVDMRKRSDTGKPNTSPQTTILPALRVPQNCQRTINLLAFDPDGDKVTCRYGNDSLSECTPCTPPSVLSLSPSCTLSFSTNSSSAVGSYAVQLMMEDFPRQDINLTQTNGAREVKTTRDAISKIPIQFAFKVDPAAPSCSEGLYLPRFLPPTPDNRAQIIAAVNQTLEIIIRAEATQSVITGFLFSGPYNVVKNTYGSGKFSLRWTPSGTEEGQSHAICFTIQARYSSDVYQSELRCVVVIVGSRDALYLRMKVAPTMCQNNNMVMPLKVIKSLLIFRGMPPSMRVVLLSDDLVEVTPT